MKAKMAVDRKYLHLIGLVPLLPIETKKDYRRARALLHELIERDEQLQPAELGYAKVLGKLVQDYARERTEGFFRQQVPGCEILQSLMDDHDLNQVEIAEIAGIQKQNVNAYLKGRRALPRAARQRLGKRFKVNPEIFIFRAADMELLPDEDDEDAFFEKVKKGRSFVERRGEHPAYLLSGSKDLSTRAERKRIAAKHVKRRAKERDK